MGRQVPRVGLLRFNGAAKRDPAIAAWLDDQSDDLRSLAKRWFARIRCSGSDVRELLHDGAAYAAIHMRLMVDESA